MPYDKTKHKLIDLRKLTDPDDNTYICEYDDVRLIPYFDTKGERITRGKLFQCPRCGQIKDTEMDNLKKPELLIAKGETQPVNMVHLRQSQPQPHQPFDIDSGDDQMYKGMGFHIVKTRIMSGDGRILRND